MDFKPKKPKVEIQDEFFEKYPHDLQMYIDHPNTQITLNEFQDFAIERLKVLRVLETITLKGNNRSYEDYKKAVVAELHHQGLSLYKKLITFAGKAPANNSEKNEIFEARQRDHVSHFILRLAYCQSEEYRRWFIAREVELFKLRWSSLPPDSKRTFLKVNNLNFSPVDEETFNHLSSSSDGYIKTCNEYYCVKWTDVLDLVRNRRVFLERGRAYVSSDDLISVLGSVFRSNLSHSLGVMSHKLPILMEDERLKRLIKNLHQAYTGKSYVTNTSNKHVSLHNLDSLSKSSFPLCMRQMYSALKTDHHLRHSARIQLGLFLKGIGLSMDDALTFWRTEFCKKLDLDTFERKYTYNIRYNYGKEGQKKNYTPYSCIKLISSSPGPGECHGCPFRHNDVPSLKQIFISQNLSPSEINDILQFVNMKQYQLACGKYFEIRHKIPLPVVTHPNQYFEEAQKLSPAGSSDVSRTQSTSKMTVTENPAKPPEFLNDSEFDGVDWDNIGTA